MASRTVSWDEFSGEEPPHKQQKLDTDEMEELQPIHNNKKSTKPHHQDEEPTRKSTRKRRKVEEMDAEVGLLLAKITPSALQITPQLGNYSVKREC